MPQSQKSRKFSTKSQYRDALKVVRKFAKGFSTPEGFDGRKSFTELTPYQKRKFRRYIALIDEQTSRPFKVIRPRKKKRLRGLQEYSQQQDFPRGLKAAFVPVADPSEKVEIKYDKAGKVKTLTEAGLVEQMIVNFDPQLLIDDPAAAARDVINRAVGMRQYQLLAADYEIAHLVAPDERILTDYIVYLQERYGADKFDPLNSSSHYFGNWLNGIKAYNFKKMKTWDEYITEKTIVKGLLRELRTTRSEKKRKEVAKKLEKYKLKAYRQRARSVRK